MQHCAWAQKGCLLDAMVFRTMMAGSPMALAVWRLPPQDCQALVGPPQQPFLQSQRPHLVGGSLLPREGLRLRLLLLLRLLLVRYYWLGRALHWRRLLLCCCCLASCLWRQRLRLRCCWLVA